MTHSEPSVIRATATVISALAGAAGSSAPATMACRTNRTRRTEPPPPRFPPPRGSDEPARSEVAHKGAGAEGPGLAIARMPHPVDEPAELRRRDGDDVADPVGEALARHVAVLDRREHGAEEQHGAVGVAVIRADHLRDEVLRIAADPGDRGRALEAIAFRPLDDERHRRLAHVVE